MLLFYVIIIIIIIIIYNRHAANSLHKAQTSPHSSNIKQKESKAV